MDSSRVILIPGTPPLPYAYEQLPSSSADAKGQEERRAGGGLRWRACAAVVALVVAAVVFGAGGAGRDAVAASVPATPATEFPRSRGKEHGVSEKTSGAYSANGDFPWSNAMLQWQRTGFHFQPDKYYQNDPNGCCLDHMDNRNSHSALIRFPTFADFKLIKDRCVQGCKAFTLALLEFPEPINSVLNEFGCGPLFLSGGETIIRDSQK